jgi:hypothetical protein
MTVLLNSKINYLEITIRILLTTMKAVMLLPQSSSRSHSNVTSPRSYLDKGIFMILVMGPGIQVCNQNLVLIPDFLDSNPKIRIRNLACWFDGICVPSEINTCWFDEFRIS